MSKKKRVRRDLEKFYRTGRYWELLRLLESQNAVSHNPKEHKEAWQALTRQALKQGAAFERFCAEVEALKKYPDDPDFRLLMLLKGFVENRNTAQNVLDLKGLTPAAEQIRSNFTAFAAEPGDGDNKLKALLQKFIREPGKITGRYYEHLGQRLPGDGFGRDVSRMGHYIGAFRRLNGKAAVSRGWNGVSTAALRRLDATLSALSGALPSALRDILLHPFVHNLAVMCRRLAPETKIQQGGRFVHAIPFFFSYLACEQSEAIRSRLLPDLDDWPTGATRPRSALVEDLKELGLEAKVSLLARLRGKGMGRPSRKERFADPDFFDEEDDDEKDRGESIHLARTVLAVHRSILKDISQQASALPAREKRELVQVMEPILCTDLHLVLDAMEERGELVSFLGEILDSGCAGTRLSLLSLLAGASCGNRNLRNCANKLLDQVPEPTLEDFEWLSGEWIDLYYPSARSLNPLLKRYGDRRQLMQIFAVRICSEVELELMEWSAKGQLPKFLSDLFGEFAPRKPRNPGILRRELAELKEYEVFNLARQFLACYPEDRMTLQGHICWFNALYSIRPEDFWGNVVVDLRRYGEIGEADDGLPPLDMLEKIRDERIEALLLFMQEHVGELQTLSMDELGPVLDELLVYSKTLIRHHRLLIHLNNLLAERFEAGDEAVRPMLDRIRNIMLILAKPAKKPAHRSRRKPL